MVQKWKQTVHWFRLGDWRLLYSWIIQLQNLWTMFVAWHFPVINSRICTTNPDDVRVVMQEMLIHAVMQIVVRPSSLFNTLCDLCCSLDRNSTSSMDWILMDFIVRKFEEEWSEVNLDRETQRQSGMWCITLIAPIGLAWYFGAEIKMHLLDGSWIN